MRIKLKKKHKKESAKWLNRHFNDEYVLRSKKEGYRSRSSYKLIQINERFDFIKSIKENMNKGGILVLSEKINFNDSFINKQKIDAHEKFKSKNNYTNLEIKQKKIALDGVLFPEEIKEHVSRLNKIGFKKIYHVFQSINFMTMVIINE